MPGFIQRHRKSLFLVSLFAILFWLVSFQVKAGRFALLERPVLAVSGFFERIITGAYNGIASVGRGYAFLVRTSRENARLKDRVAQLELENQITNELLAENDRLRAALGFQKIHTPRSQVVMVIGRQSSPSSSTLTVNKGSDHGLAKNQAVITPAGVVGRVVSVLPSTAKVQLITDPGSTLAVRVLRNREEGLLEGKLDRCAMKYVSFYVDIQEGDELVTSGLDGIYPKGLPAGTVTSVAKHESRSFQTVTARPVVPFSRLEEALVLIP